MQVYWQSFGEFLAMGGYAPFVWGAYGVTAVLVVAEFVLLARDARTSAGRAGRNPQPDPEQR